MSPFLPACSHLLPFTPDREDADWPKSGFLCKVSLVNERPFSEAWASPCKAALLQRPTPHPPPLPPPTPSAHGQVHCWSPLTKDKPEGCTDSSQGLPCVPALLRRSPPQQVFLFHDLGEDEPHRALEPPAPPRGKDMRSDGLRVITASLIQEENGHELSK